MLLPPAASPVVHRASAPSAPPPCLAVPRNRVGPDGCGAAEGTGFLSFPTVEKAVRAGTQRRARAALLLLHRDVLEHELPWLDQLVRAERPKRLPVVLTRAEVAAVLAVLDAKLARYRAGRDRLVLCAGSVTRDLQLQRPVLRDTAA